MKNVFVFGSINMDLVISSPYLPQAGETIRGSDFMTNPGGKGANQASACGKLGNEVFMIGTVGNDLYGQKAIETLMESNVHTNYITINNEHSTGIAVILLTEGNNRIITDSGANQLSNKNQLEKCINQYASSGDLFITQLEIPLDEVYKSLKLAKERDLFTILNPAPAVSLSDDLLKYVDLIILNETEAKLLTGFEPTTNESIIVIDAYFKSKHIKHTILTLGNKGSASVENGCIIDVEAIEVKVVDTTSAGDAYIGAIAYSLSNDQTIQEAMQYATLVSGLTVTKKGANQSIPTKSEIEDYLKHRKKE